MAADDENQPKSDLPPPSSAHPCMVDHPAEANVKQVSLGNGETAVQDSQPSNKDKLPGIDINQRVGSVGTTVDALEGGCI